jgi:hypothetical protein
MAKFELPDREPARRLRIRSDGTGRNTVVEVVSNDGSDPVRLADATAVTWTVRASSLATATVEFAGVEVDVVAEEEVSPPDHESQCAWQIKVNADSVDPEELAEMIRKVDEADRLT